MLHGAIPCRWKAFWMRTTSLLLLIVSLAHATNSVSSWTNNQIPAKPALSTDPHSTEELHFQGEFHQQQHVVLSWPAKPDELFAFCQDPARRDHLLKGGGNPTDYVTGTPELYQQWRAESKVVGSQPPSDDHQDPILAIHSTVPLFPGLSIRAISYTGCKLLRHPQTSLPVFEFTLIRESYVPAGPKPMLWIFHKITGGGGGGGGDHHSNDNEDLVTAATETRLTHSLCRVSIERSSDTPGGWNVDYYGKVRVASRIPKRLLKLMPLSKNKLESKVSKSIVKQIKREGVQSLQKFKTALGEWKR